MSDDLVILEKQKYLRDHVLEKGYSAENFVSYLQSVKEGGDDLGAWTLDELKEAVEKFVKMQVANPGAVMLAEAVGDEVKPEQTSPVASAVAVPEIAIEQHKEETKKTRIVKQYADFIKTQKMATSELTAKKVIIKVQDPIVKAGGIFSSTTIHYRLETQPLGWLVTRTYAECIWLHDQLAKHFPALVVPYINKKGAKDKNKSKSIMKRVAWLQKFFEELQRDRTLRSSEIFQMFMRVVDKKEFERKMKELSKVPAPKGISDIKHLEGQADVSMSLHKKELGRAIRTHVEQAPALYRDLIAATVDTSKIMRLLSDALARNAKLYNQLAVSYATVESVELTDMFCTIQKITESLSDLYTKQATLLQDRFGEIFRYYKDELSSLTDICKTQERLELQVNEKEGKLQMKKERLFLEARVQSWELRPEDIKGLDISKAAADKSVIFPLMLPRESEELYGLMITHGYYTNKLLEETRRTNQKNYRTLRKHFKGAGEEYAELLKNILEKWAGIVEHFGAKVSKFERTDRSKILAQLKQELGVPGMEEMNTLGIGEPIEILAQHDKRLHTEYCFDALESRVAQISDSLIILNNTSSYFIMGKKEGAKEETKDSKAAYKTDLPKQAARFAELYVISLSSPSSGMFYIISALWWTKWKSYVSFNETKMQWERGRDMGRVNPGEISNKDILASPEEYYVDPTAPLYLQSPLRPGLLADKHLIVLGQECAQFLYDIYGGVHVVRYGTRKPDGGVEVEPYPFTLKVVILPCLPDFFVDVPLRYKQLLVGRSMTVDSLKKQLVKSILPGLGFEGNMEKCRLWKVDPIHDNLTLATELEKMEISPAKYNRSLNTLLQEFNCGLSFPGVSADFYPEAPVAKLFADSLYLTVERASKSGEFIFKYTRKVKPGVCPACNFYKTLMVACSCGKAMYCTEECKEKDRQSHSQICPDVGIGDIYVEKKANAKRGVVGLANMGNTCYLNGALQCLNNTFELSKYFLDNKFAAELNTTNALGCGGELAQAYAKFVYSMWNNDESVVTPHYLKKALSKFHPIYAGYVQHDAQETISFLLDGLHEDLNRVKAKPYIELQQFTADNATAGLKSAWDVHLQRNQSVIVDLMHGLFRSATCCPQCHQTSVVGEPFCLVPLPIPEKDSLLCFTCYYVPYGVKEQPTRVDVELNKFDTLELLHKKIAAVIGTGKYIVCTAGQELRRVYTKTATTAAELKADISSSRDATHVMMFEVPEEEYKSLVTVPVKIGFENEVTQSVDYLTYTRLLFTSEKTTVQTLYKEIVQYFWEYLVQIFSASHPGHKLPHAKEFIEELSKEDPGATPEMALSPYFMLNLEGEQETVCAVCGKQGCLRCPLPYSNLIKVGDLLKKKPESGSDPMLRLEMVWSRKGRLLIAPHINQYKEVATAGSKAGAKYTTTLHDCFATFAAPEVLDEDNKWFCPSCKTHVKGTKTTVISIAPKILIVALKRFKSFGSGMKNKDFIEFPVSGLDVSKYLGEEAIVASKTKYNLFAVCNHYGHLGGGHYTAFAKHVENGKWYLYDDSWVTQVKEEDVVSAAAYVLFYRREDVIPQKLDFEAIKLHP